MRLLDHHKYLVMSAPGDQEQDSKCNRDNYLRVCFNSSPSIALDTLFSTCSVKVVTSKCVPSSMQAAVAFHGLLNSKVAPQSAVEHVRRRSSLVEVTTPIQLARDRVWRFQSDPSSSRAASLWSIIVILAIISANVFHIIETLPVFSSTLYPGHMIFYFAEYSTLAIFTVEIVLTLLSAPKWSCVLDVAFILDVIVIIPSYAELLLGRTGGVSLSMLRVFRLLRVLRLFRVSRSSTVLVISAVRRSLSVLVMFVILAFIIVTIAGAVMHVLERGVWNSEFGEWRRETLWTCHYDVGMTNGIISVHGAEVKYVPPSCHLLRSTEEEATFKCNVPIETGYDCVPVQWDVSPFGSIPDAMWWAVVSICTVGTISCQACEPKHWVHRLVTATGNLNSKHNTVELKWNHACLLQGNGTAFIDAQVNIAVWWTYLSE